MEVFRREVALQISNEETSDLLGHFESEKYGAFGTFFLNYQI